MTGTWLGLELHDNTPIDSVYLISTGNSSMDVLTSSDNNVYDLIDSTVLTREDLYINFVLDLVKRHSLSIVRHYGIGNLFDISLTLKTHFSNTSGSINNAVFNSSSSDCRWLGIKK